MASQSTGGQKKHPVIIPAGVTEVQYRKALRRQQQQQQQHATATHHHPPLAGHINTNRHEDSNTGWVASVSHGMGGIDIIPNQRSNSMVGSSGSSRYLDDISSISRRSQQRFVHTNNASTDIVRVDVNHHPDITAPTGSSTAVIRMNNNHSLDSAALQADMTRRYDLSSSLPIPIPRRRERRGGHRGGQQQQQQQSIHQRSTVTAQTTLAVSPALPNICGCCTAVNEQGELICTACGYYLNSLLHNQQQPEETVAQRRGLVPPLSTTTTNSKLKPLTPLSWHAIEASISVKDDPDSNCPICMEPFTSSCEVLLSCSHIFHQTCLRSFENFLRDGIPSCPLCRSRNYQKKTTALGTLGYQKACVRTIQRCVRGFLARRAFKVELRLFHRGKQGDEGRRKRFFEREFHSLAAKLSHSIDHRSRRVDSVLRSMDHTIHESQQLDLLFDHMLQSRLHSNADADATAHATSYISSSIRQRNVRGDDDDDDVSNSKEEYADKSGYCSETNTNWIEVFNSAVLRCPSDCAICMLPIHCSQSGTASTGGIVSGGGANKRDVLLSCSHLFHEKCILSFERFLSTTTTTTTATTAAATASQLQQAISNSREKERKRKKKSCPVCRSSYSRRLFRLPTTGATTATATGPPPPLPCRPPTLNAITSREEDEDDEDEDYPYS